MKRMKIYHNEDGLTLIEILASLVIISIVLISFSTILLQAMKHTKYNEEKLTEVDIAEEVIGEIRANNNCENVQKKYEDPTHPSYNADPRYKVTVACDVKEDDLDLPAGLKKATVSVEVKEKVNAQKKSSFSTGTYYKVGGDQ